MATTIKTKSSNVQGKVPDSSSLQPAELAINLKDQKLYSKDVDGVVFEVGKDADVDLGYTPAADKGTITNTAGDDAELPLADDTNAGLLAPGDKDKLDEITIGGGGGLDIAGYVKLNDEGNEQDIIGGGGLAVEGNVTATNVRTQAVVFQATGGGFHAGAIRFDVGPKALYEFSGVTEQAFELDGNPVLNLKPDGSAVVAGGVTASFGTSSSQLGNVAPLNDWSCYPARTTTYSAPPAPPAPTPEPVDPDFGVDEPTFSGGLVSAGIASGGFIGTQDIIDLEGE